MGNGLGENFQYEGLIRSTAGEAVMFRLLNAFLNQAHRTRQTMVTIRQAKKADWNASGGYAPLTWPERSRR